MYTLPKEATAFAAIGPAPSPSRSTTSVSGSSTISRQLVYLGSANTEVNLCWVRNDAKVKSFKDLFSNELIIGAGGEGDSTRDFAVAENNILGTKFRVIQRYPGVRDTVLAIDRNEVEGVCGPAYRR